MTYTNETTGVTRDALERNAADSGESLYDMAPHLWAISPTGAFCYWRYPDGTFNPVPRLFVTRTEMVDMLRTMDTLKEADHA